MKINIKQKCHMYLTRLKFEHMYQIYPTCYYLYCSIYGQYVIHLEKLLEYLQHDVLDTHELVLVEGDSGEVPTTLY